MRLLIRIISRWIKTEVSHSMEQKKATDDEVKNYLSLLQNFLSTVYGKFELSEEKGGTVLRLSQNKGVTTISNVTVNPCKNEDFVAFRFKIAGSKQRYVRNAVVNSLYGYQISEDPNDKTILAGCVLPKSGKLDNDEFDCNADALSLYKAVYGNKIKGNSKSGLCYKYADGKTIDLKGDIDFNFKAIHLLYLENLIKGTSEEKETSKHLWNMMNNLTYHPNNISIMPVTGGLNNTKKSVGNDRLDVFLLALKLYYQENGYPSLLLSSGKQSLVYWSDINVLKEYLDSFDGLYDYCDKVYHINEELVDLLCESGRTPIDSAARVVEYIHLAWKFWLQKDEYYKKSNDRVKTCYQTILKRVVEAAGKNYINLFTGKNSCLCVSHKMDIQPEVFAKIESGQTTIELRLNDEKHQEIREGDNICFNNTESGKQIVCEVISPVRQNQNGVLEIALQKIESKQDV